MRADEQHRVDAGVVEDDADTVCRIGDDVHRRHRFAADNAAGQLQKAE